MTGHSEMTFDILHVTEYRYSEPVTLDHHVVRLTPRPGPSQIILSHELTIEPTPKGRTELTDAEGNAAVYVWFAEKTDYLRIVNHCVVETLIENPFDFVLSPEDAQIPMRLDPSEHEALNLYLERPWPSKAVDAWAQGLVEKANASTIAFISELNKTLYEDFDTLLRESGDPYSPEECLTLRTGACRDLTVLFIDACRSVGIPARFVSGYQEAEGVIERHLHAWPEVYLPGAGWRGYDPTMNLAVANRHVPLAASYSSFGAAPVTGSFWGRQVVSTLSHSLELSVSA